MSRIFICPERKLITVNILYFRPDYDHIVQEFLWQTVDITPDLPRVHRFLNYWRDNIEAIISEIVIVGQEKQTGEWRKIDIERTLN